MYFRLPAPFARKHCFLPGLSFWGGADGIDGALRKVLIVVAKEEGSLSSAMTCLALIAELVRPHADMWHVSASMYILDGTCSEALAGRMGWDQPVQAQILACQLLKLSEMHPEVCHKAVLLPSLVFDFKLL
jgi:hypothetical protein